LNYNVIYNDLGTRDYKETWDIQNGIFNDLVNQKSAISSGKADGSRKMPGTLIFVEHPHVYTLGKSGIEENLLVNALQLKKVEATFYKTDRGGDITYHGPGQIVGYPILDLEEIGIGLKEYVHRLEEAIIMTLRNLNINAERFSGGTGVWIEPDSPGKARKICAIGVRSSRYITMHGFAFNVNTDLSYFNNINPCGFKDKGVTSIEKELGERQNIDKIKIIIRDYLSKVLKLNLQ
jgi:lipoyl(octanoyl) transferase